MTAQDNSTELESSIVQAIEAATNVAALEDVRVAALGKKGSISALLKTLGGMSNEQRQEKGPVFNQLRDRITQSIAQRKQAIEADPLLSGRIHPVSQVMDELSAIFADMGFDVAEGPDIESDYYNFTALNVPPEHPARQEHDTFYLPADANGKRKVLRTHTSPVQIRTMEANEPPIRIIVPGRTYRSDHDATHSPMFHQCEGLVIGDGIHMGHLKGCLIDFCRAFFGVDDLPVRLRTSYFPFTEASAEVDIGCTRDNGALKIGAGDDWLEILGSGMVNPLVLENCGYDPEKYQGFAFGMGIERIAMLKYGIPDLRTFYDSDLRWMRHYGFLPFDAPSIHAGLAGGSV